MVKDIYTLDEKMRLIDAIRDYDMIEVSITRLCNHVCVGSGRGRYILDWLVEQGFVSKIATKLMGHNYARFCYTVTDAGNDWYHSAEESQQ